MCDFWKYFFVCLFCFEVCLAAAADSFDRNLENKGKASVEMAHTQGHSFLRTSGLFLRALTCSLNHLSPHSQNVLSPSFLGHGPGQRVQM